LNGHAFDAEDALSEVMLRARDRLPSCAGEIANLEAWLHRLARNLCIDLRRKRLRRFEAVEDWSDPAAEAAEAEPAMRQAEMKAEIQKRIAALPPDLRETFDLHAVQGISSQEVALQLGTSPANVRKRVQLARARLQRAVAAGRADRDGPDLATNSPAPAAPAGSVRCAPKGWVDFPPAAALCTACVKLPCGVEHLFHVFPNRAPLARGRRMKSLHGYLQNHPGSWKKRLELAELYQMAGEWIKAVGEWRRALEKRPYLPAVLKLGAALLKLGEPAAAAEVFGRARSALRPSEAMRRHLEGWIAFCRKEAGRSVREFQAAADADPENPLHWHGLALACRKAGAAPGALAAIRRALVLNPDDPVALSEGHEIFVAAGQVEEALRRALRLWTLYPLDLLTGWRLIDCRCRLGLTHGEAGHETKLLLRRMLNASSNALVFREPRAAFFIARGERPKALAVHRQFAERHSHCPRGQETYARMLAAGGGDGRWPGQPYILDLPPANRCNGACTWCEAAR
jgi:RNA polymerase sigma factor (sigma-70 family)